MKPIFLIIFFAISNAGELNSQTLEEMMDDGRFGEERLILKVNPTAMLTGDFSTSAEARITERISIEAGTGWITGYYLKDPIHYTFSDDESFTIPSDKMTPLAALV